MRTKLLTMATLLACSAMISGASVAQADTTATVAPTELQRVAATPEQSPSVGPMALTDTQMNEVTAGHYTGYWHWGYWYNWSNGLWYLGWHY